MKLTWGCTHKFTWGCTHEFTSIRTKVISRYVKFFQMLLQSASKEVRLIAQLVARDKSSTTGINLAKIQVETKLNPWTTHPMLVQSIISKSVPTIE